MKKMLSLLMVTVFSLSITAFTFAEGKPAADAASTKVEDQKAPAAEKKATAKKHTKKKKKSAKKKSAAAEEKAEKAPEQPATKK